MSSLVLRPSTLAMVTAPILAHATGAGLPISSAGLAYLTVAVVALTALALRSTWVTPRLPSGARAIGPRPHTWPARVPAALATVVGAVVEATLLLVAFTGDPAAGANLTPTAVFFVYWVGVVVVSLLVGEAAAWWCPWLGIARAGDWLRGLRNGDEYEVGAAAANRGPALPWLAPLALWTLPALWLATDGGNGPHAIGWWLVGHLAVFGIGGLVWGEAWVAAHEPLIVASRTVGALSPIGRTADGRVGVRRPLGDTDPPIAPATLLGTASVLIGTAVFSRVRISRWWQQHAVNQSLLVRDVAHLAGLAWFAVLTAAVWAGTSNWVERQALATGPESSDPEGADAGAVTDRLDTVASSSWLAVALVPIAVTTVAARFVEQFSVQIQNVIAMASDPFSRGWNLFGTIDNTFYPRPFSPAGRAWTQLALVLIGFVAALVVAHDRIVERHGPLVARRTQAVVVFVLGAGCVASTIGLLGA